MREIRTKDEGGRMKAEGRLASSLPFSAVPKGRVSQALTPTLSRSTGRGSNSRAGCPCHRRGFTLIEALAALVLIAIVLPVAMRGVSVALAASSIARHRAEAATLASSKLDEMVTMGTWDSSEQQGDFGLDWPGYRWECLSVNRDQNLGLTEVAVTVTWTERGVERSVSVATLVQQGTTTSSTTASAGGAP